MKTGNTYAVAGLLAMSVLLGGLTGCPLFWKITATPENVTVAVDATKDVAVVSTDSNDTTFEWVSDNEAVATVAAVGNGATATVTGVAEGTATLTVTGADSNLSDTVNVTVFVDLASIGERFSSSLHGTRVGKATWYNGTEAEPGLLSLTGIPMEELPCMGCHGPNYADGTPVDAGSYTAGCGDCHVDPEHPAAITDQAVCLPCHSRQGREIQMDNAGNPLFDDVHRNAGMTCMSCHKFDEIHGDGTAYTSILESPSADCEDCHVEGGTAPVPP
ncbi:MAG: Ig-like domain-containing protein, partial [Candidatus Hydrogenedentes bacterium]|nr:Ig-like domain-containing protein [Candidatus Hydrogenedentota bacterium]